MLKYSFSMDSSRKSTLLFMLLIANPKERHPTNELNQTPFKDCKEGKDPKQNLEIVDTEMGGIEENCSSSNKQQVRNVIYLLPPQLMNFPPSLPAAR